VSLPQNGRSGTKGAENGSINNQSPVNSGITAYFVTQRLILATLTETDRQTDRQTDTEGQRETET